MVLIDFCDSPKPHGEAIKNKVPRGIPWLLPGHHKDQAIRALAASNYGLAMSSIRKPAARLPYEDFIFW
jgi:hypothetical protein